MNFGSSSSNVGTTSSDMEKKMKTMESQMQVLITYISAKEGDTIPEELAGLFPNFTQQVYQ